MAGRLCRPHPGLHQAGNIRDPRHYCGHRQLQAPEAPATGASALPLPGLGLLAPSSPVSLPLSSFFHLTGRTLASRPAGGVGGHGWTRSHQPAAAGSPRLAFEFRALGSVSQFMGPRGPPGTLLQVASHPRNTQPSLGTQQQTPGEPDHSPHRLLPARPSQRRAPGTAVCGEGEGANSLGVS